MLRRTLLTSALLTATIAPGTGCWLVAGSGTPLIEAEDVRMEPPGTMGFRQLGDKGEVYGLALDVSDDVNGWVTDIAVGMSKLVHELDQHPASRNPGRSRRAEGYTEYPSVWATPSKSSLNRFSRCGLPRPAAQ